MQRILRLVWLAAALIAGPACTLIDQTPAAPRSSTTTTTTTTGHRVVRTPATTVETTRTTQY